MKSLFFISVLFSFFAGTSATAQSNNSIETKSLKFIENIEISGVERVPALMPVNQEKKMFIQAAATSNKTAGQIEKSNALQFKYAQLLDKEVETIINVPLYHFIDDWMDTRYRYGGTTKKGIDCSAFTSLLMNNVYDINLPRTAREQYNACLKVNEGELKEGDLLFFNTRGGVSHVAVYLGDHYFVHASTSNGVMISNLDDPYYSNHFIGGGRISCGVNDVAGTSISPQECTD